MSIKNQAISGVKWTTLSTIVLAIASLLKISVLARFIDKADFGLMALVMFVLGFMNLFMNMGLTTAILHKQGITKSEYASLYWLNFAFSILLYLLILVISPYIAGYYQEQELNILIPLMGCSLLISAFGRQFKTIKQKELKFKTIAIVDISVALLSLLIATFLAYKGFGVYALVFSALIQFLFSNITFFVLGIKEDGLKFHFSFIETKPFLRIGMYQIGGQVANYFNRNLDTLIIGKYFGVDILGGYSLAKQLVFRPTQVINPIFTRVSAPILARLQGNIEFLRVNYLKLLNIVSSLNIFIFSAVIIFAPLIVKLLYGGGFEDIIPLVRILSVYMIFRSFGNPIGILVIATGRTDLAFKWNLIILFFTPIAIYFGAQFSIEWVAGALTMMMMILLVPAWWFMIKKMLSIDLTTYLKTIFFVKYNFKDLII